MVNVSGSIKLVTNQPANIHEVWLRAPQGRVHGTGYMAELPGVAVVNNNGQVSFEVLPGASLMVLISGSRPVGTVKMLVPDKANATLRECIEAAGLADDGTLSALEYLALDVARIASQIASADQLETWAGETAQAARDANAAAERAENTERRIDEVVEGLNSWSENAVWNFTSSPTKIRFSVPFGAPPSIAVDVINGSGAATIKYDWAPDGSHVTGCVITVKGYGEKISMIAMGRSYHG